MTGASFVEFVRVCRAALATEAEPMVPEKRRVLFDAAAELARSELELMGVRLAWERDGLVAAIQCFATERLKYLDERKASRRIGCDA